MRIALLDDYHRIALTFADWRRVAGRVEPVSFDRHIGNTEELVRSLRGFDAVVAMRERTKLPRTVLEQLPELSLIITTGMWNASIDIDYATVQGIQVCGTGDVGHATAELTIGLMLSLARQIPNEDRALREGRWQDRLGSCLQGKTLGILGLGNLGRQVSRFARTFGMDVVAWSENLTAESAAAAGARHVDRHTLLTTADYVTIHLRLSDRTRGMLDAKALASMKPSAYLINTSRGPIVDESALADALQRRAIAGAALDVYGTEPLPLDAPLRRLDNVILLPHIGYVVEENYRLMYGDALEDIEAFLAGQPIRALNRIVHHPSS